MQIAKLPPSIHYRYHLYICTVAGTVLLKLSLRGYMKIRGRGGTTDPNVRRIAVNIGINTLSI